VPGGKLPFTWPRTVGQVPMYYAHTISHEPENQWRRYWDEESTPLFPFGHGLSYGSFSYGDLTLDASSVALEGSVTVSVDVTNTGDRDADEVVQLYLHQRHGRASRPVRELKGFERVAVGAGQTRTVTFQVTPDHRRYWNAAERDWVLDPSTFDVWVGGSSTAERTATFEVTA
jgi:beta-glucosidase